MTDQPTETPAKTRVVVPEDKLTLGDMEDFEDHTGMMLEDAFNAGKPSMKAIIALLWIVRRVENPAYTLADARAISIADIDDLEIVFPDAAGDPTAAAPVS